LRQIGAFFREYKDDQTSSAVYKLREFHRDLQENHKDIQEVLVEDLKNRYEEIIKDIERYQPFLLCLDVNCGKGTCFKGTCDFCNPDQCNRGTCISDLNHQFSEGYLNFTCKCDKGYIGTYCNKLEDDPCENDPAAVCKNNGTCIVKIKPGPNEWICQCPGKPKLGQAKDCSKENNSPYPLPDKVMVAIASIPLYAVVIACVIYGMYECIRHGKVPTIRLASAASSISLSSVVPRWERSSTYEPASSEAQKIISIREIISSLVEKDKHLSNLDAGESSKACEKLQNKTISMTNRTVKGQVVNTDKAIGNTEDLKGSAFDMESTRVSVAKRRNTLVDAIKAVRHSIGLGKSASKSLSVTTVENIVENKPESI